MQGIVKLALAAALVAGVSAQPHQHNHRHYHVKKHEHAAPVERRETTTVTSFVSGPTVLSYVLDGQVIDQAAAEEGIKDGLYIVMGTSTPTSTSVLSTSTSISSSATEAGQFFEEKTSSSTSTTSTSTTSTSSTPTPTTTSTSTTPVVTSATSSASTSTAMGLNAEFPSGKIKCSDGVPTAYGPIEVSWMGMKGWTGIQYVGSYTSGIAISNIQEPISGGCVSGSFCSYACPAGYQKTQWPEGSQGSTGQSIGGLWCNNDGYLELSRTSVSTLCEAGAGGVYVKNQLSTNAAVCRTDYPGTENMDVPLDTQPGNTYPLTNPDASTYYQWEGKTTSAQYYVNPSGVAVSDACLWTSSTNPLSAGNWAPVNLGVGKDSTGTTYLSIFANSPTSSAHLDFNIEITGDVSSDCYLKGGSYSGGGTGCTTAITNGGTAYFVFTSSS